MCTPDDHRFENLKFYRFDIEVAKFLKEGIVTAKKARSRSVTVSGCLHIIECLYSQDNLPMIHIQNKRERKDDEVEMDEPTPAFKRSRNNIGNCSKDYPVKTEPQSENPEIEIIDIDDDSGEEDINDEDYDEELDQVPLQYFMTLKRETIDKVASPLEYTSSGQPFAGQHSSRCVVLNDEKCENVEGFSVLRTQADLYKKIFSRHGHIASSKVLTDPYAQVPVVSGIMTTITEMHDTRFSDLNSEMLEAWEKNIMNCEKVEFNIRWVRKWLEKFKKDFFVKEKLVAELTEHDDLLKEEEKKCVAAKNAQKEAEYKIVALKSNTSPLIKEKRKYDEKENCLLSEWWLQ